MTLRLDRRSFRKWLEEHDPGETVGRAGTAESCPIANYLWTRGVDMPLVWYGEIEWIRDDSSSPFWGRRRIPSNHWVAQYIERLDDPEAQFDVSAHLALEVLDELEAELQAV